MTLMLARSAPRRNEFMYEMHKNSALNMQLCHASLSLPTPMLPHKKAQLVTCATPDVTGRPSETTKGCTLNGQPKLKVSRAVGEPTGYNHGYNYPRPPKEQRQVKRANLALKHSLCPPDSLDRRKAANVAHSTSTWHQPPQLRALRPKGLAILQAPNTPTTPPFLVEGLLRALACWGGFAAHCLP